MREPLIDNMAKHIDDRITPACAGTTARFARILAWMEDHPRVCGNHIPRKGTVWETRGSPPRVREPRITDPNIVRAYRITPACAGTTHVIFPSFVQLQDHPRVCGNHIAISYLVKSNLGSPPRVREPLLNPVPVVQAPGITPACAGTTHRRWMCRLLGGDHPRVCGNHQLLKDALYPLRGSPPRVREPPLPDET